MEKTTSGKEDNEKKTSQEENWKRLSLERKQLHIVKETFVKKTTEKKSVIFVFKVLLTIPCNAVAIIFLLSPSL
jgi:hypothetical protein